MLNDIIVLLKNIKMKELLTDEEIKNTFEERILNINKGPVSYYFAKNINGADIKAHGKVVIESKDLGLNYLFAKNIKGADIKAHEKVILESKDPEWNYYFAKDIENADVKAHGKIVMESKDPEWNYNFSKNIKGADVEDHRKVISKCKKEQFNKLLKRINKRKKDNNNLHEVKKLSLILDSLDNK